MERKLPENIIINGLSYRIVEYNDPEYLSISDSCKQEIGVRMDMPYPKQLQVLFREVGWRLLEACGLKDSSTNHKYCRQFGNVLYRFIRDNDFSFIHEKTYELPCMLWINGLPYYKDETRKEYMEAKSLGGEVCYEQLSIRLEPSLEPEIKTVVYLHEAAHAMLHEAETPLASREDIVEPLAYLLFQFFTDNDLSYTTYQKG